MTGYVDRRLLKEDIGRLIIRSIHECNDQCVIGLTFAYYTVSNAPSADVQEVKHGKWKFNKDGSAVCSECGRTQHNCWDLDNWDNFCHFCGADMRESYGK